jgi:hypothetical protein
VEEHRGVVQMSYPLLAMAVSGPWNGIGSSITTHLTGIILPPAQARARAALEPNGISNTQLDTAFSERDSEPQPSHRCIDRTLMRCHLLHRTRHLGDHQELTHREDRHGVRIVVRTHGGIGLDLVARGLPGLNV